MGRRRKLAIYNIYNILVKLRIVFYQLSERFFYKKASLLNYVSDEKIKKYKFILKRLKNFPKRKFMVSSKKWVGGVLTNFKGIAKRILTRQRNKSPYTKKQKFNVSYPRNVPRLPSMVISMKNCHWTLNETKLLRINSVQFVDTHYLGSFGDTNIGMNLNFYPLLTVTTFFGETAATIGHIGSFFYRKRLLNRLRKRSLAKIFSFSFVKQRAMLKRERKRKALEKRREKHRENLRILRDKEYAMKIAARFSYEDLPDYNKKPKMFNKKRANSRVHTPNRQILLKSVSPLNLQNIFYMHYTKKQLKSESWLIKERLKNIF